MIHAKRSGAKQKECRSPTELRGTLLTMPAAPRNLWIVSKTEIADWWERGTGFDRFAVVLFAGVILLALAALFVPRLRRALARSAPRWISCVAAVLLGLLLLIVAMGGLK